MHRQRFESLQHASRAIADWIQFHNLNRPGFRGGRLV
ncbi:hypothetical protein [Burkholderia gladioli]|nr:hypothetical protein [Burkholderia gladioli]MDN7741656.1 hypothetical protein [Burkholderia gladioli]